MKNKLLKKLGIIVLSVAIVCGTTSVNQVCVYAEDMLDIQNTRIIADGTRPEEDGGAEYDFINQGPVKGIEASNEATVTVDSVEVTDTKDSEEQEFQRYHDVNVVEINTGSEVVVEGNVDVTTQGTVGTQTTRAVQAKDYSDVTIQGDITLEDNLSYTLDKDERYPNECVAVGVDSEYSSVNVGGDVVVSSNNGIVYGVHTYDSTTNIKGSVLTSSECIIHTVTGMLVIDSTINVDGDVNVNGGSLGVGVNMFGDSKAYIKGNMTIESAERAYGVNLHDNSIAVIDGTLSVKAANTENRNLHGRPYDPYEVGTSNSCLYVYKYVDETNYFNDDDNLSDENSNFAHLKYIIKTDEGLTTSANTFSDADLGVSEFFYSGAGETITVSSNGRTIYGIKNEDSSIDIKVHDNGNGTWTIIVPKGGGVHLQAILERVEEVIEDIPSKPEKPGEGESQVIPSKTDIENEVALPQKDAESEVTPSNTAIASPAQTFELMHPVVMDAVVMTQEQLAENVTGSAEYVAKQAEIEAAMTQALNYVEVMTLEQVENLKTTGLSIDAGGCVVADAKVSQLIMRALNKGIPMNMSFRVNGYLIKFAIPAGFDMSSFIEADGTINLMQVFNAIQQRKN